MRRIVLGPCAALLHDGDPARCAVLLPGMQYSTQAPLLWFARSVAVGRGWSALEVLDSLPEGDEPFAWARDRARRALDAVAEASDVVVIGKSLASGAAGLLPRRRPPPPCLPRPLPAPPR